MTRLCLVRHGETTWNADHRFQGSSDPPLSEIGRTQARRLASRLQSEIFDAAYCSDLKRAQETAALLAHPLKLDVRTDSRLREMSFGVFEGLPPQEIQARYPDEYAAWSADRENAPPGGEPLSQMVARLKAFLTHIQNQHSEKRILAVAHGATIGVLICLLLDLHPGKQYQFRMENTATAEVQIFADHAQLLHFNDYHHLRV